MLSSPMGLHKMSHPQRQDHMTMDDTIDPSLHHPTGPPQTYQHQQGSHQEPVNFNSSFGRRVTIGGMGGNTIDRRGSLASIGGVDDLFGRRPSMGFEMNMDSLFGRRDSIDSTTAAIDAAILDLTRRRSSLFLGPGGGANDMNPPPPTPHHDTAFVQQSMNPPSLPGASFSGPGLGYERGNVSSLPFNIPSNPASLATHQDPVSTIAARQKQLQEQQRELEHYQRVLEFQRQQLLSNMQERSYEVPSLPPSTQPAVARFAQANMGFVNPVHSAGFRPSVSMSSGSLGLGSVHSAHSHASHGTAAAIPPPQQQQQQQQQQNRTGAPGSQNWWICQVCNSKAFASHEEALAHEAVCRDGRRMDTVLPHTTSMHHDSGGMRDVSTRSSFSLGMDSSARSSQSEIHYDTTMSNGPFAMMPHPMPLAMPSDKDWLTPLHCFVRRHCVEVFTASEQDVATPSKGKRKPIQVGQIGIRCPHCHIYESATSVKSRERGSVYYPTTISSIYNATMNLLQRHLHSCPAVPEEIMRRYETLKADDARSGTSKRYWVESALSLGLVDTPNGIRFSALRPPPLPSLLIPPASLRQEPTRRNSNEFFSSTSNAAMADLKIAPSMTAAGGGPPMTKATKEEPVGRASKAELEMVDMGPLVTPDDKPYSTSFSFHLLSQMQPCVFTEADRLGKRKGLPPGFPGLACRHCFGGYGSGRFFPSSIKTLSDTSKTLNVLHNHMMRCRKCPVEVREILEGLRGSHDEERAKMKFGSQKAFFARIWERLHGRNQPSMYKRRAESPDPAEQSPYDHAGHAIMNRHPEAASMDRSYNSSSGASMGQTPLSSSSQQGRGFSSAMMGGPGGPPPPPLVGMNLDTNRLDHPVTPNRKRSKVENH